MNNTRVTDTWDKYEKGLTFFDRHSYISKCSIHSDFYSGQHYNGLTRGKELPRPVLAISKRIIDFKVSSVMSEEVKPNFRIEGEPNGNDLSSASEIFNRYSKTACEDIDQRALNEEMLLNAAITGSGFIHYYYDKGSSYGNTHVSIGVMRGEVIDSTNVFLGDPTDRRINLHGKAHQPYVIIKMREHKSNIDENIQSDKLEGNEPYSNIELDDDSKATVLLHYFKKNGTVWFKKTTKNTTIVNETDTGMSIYPIAIFNWDVKKNFAYGTSEMEGQIPNQKSVNLMLALILESAKKTALPKIVYDSSRVQHISNEAGVAIGIDGDITNAIKNIDAGNISSDAFTVLNTVVTLTKDLAGANENALGEARAENTSALAWAQKQSSIPMESIRRRFYQFIKDCSLIMAEIWKVYYNIDRQIVIENDNNEEEAIIFNGAEYKDVKFNVRVDVGASSHWSEVTMLNMLNEWLRGGNISFVEYLERLPKGYITDIDKLIISRKNDEKSDNNVMYMLMKDFVNTLPEELQIELEDLAQNNPEEYEAQVKDLVVKAQQQQEIQQEEI